MVKGVSRIGNRPALICDCNCGTKNKLFYACDVVSGHVKSCWLCKLRSTIGKTSGRLTVVSIDEQRRKCICNCSCGTENYETNCADILRGAIKSCGCLAKELKNTYKFIDDYVIGTTNKGQEFYFDKEDFEKISKHTWRVSRNGYMQTTVTKRPNKVVIEMHSYLIGEHEGYVIDHINRNKRDNRKSNLRLVDRNMNGFNINRQINNTSGKTGVSFSKDKGTYIAHIGYKNKHIYLGSYSNFDDAVKTREKAELKYFGELANN